MFEKSGTVSIASGGFFELQTSDFLGVCRYSWGMVSVYIAYVVNYGTHKLIRFENAIHYLF